MRFLSILIFTTTFNVHAELSQIEVSYQVLNSHLQKSVNHKLLIFAESYVDKLDSERFPFLNDSYVGLSDVDVMLGDPAFFVYSFVKHINRWLFFDSVEYFYIRCKFTFKTYFDATKSRNSDQLIVVTDIEVEECY